MKRILLNTTVIVSLAVVTFCYAQRGPAPSQPAPNAVAPGLTLVNLKVEAPASLSATEISTGKPRIVAINGAQYKLKAGASTTSIKAEFNPQKIRNFSVSYGDMSCPIVWHQEASNMHNDKEMYTVKEIGLVLGEHKVNGKEKPFCQKAVVTIIGKKS